MNQYVRNSAGEYAIDPITLNTIPIERAVQVRGRWLDARSALQLARSRRENQVVRMLEGANLNDLPAAWVSQADLMAINYENRQRIIDRSGLQEGENEFYNYHVDVIMQRMLREAEHEQEQQWQGPRRMSRSRSRRRLGVRRPRRRQ